MAITIEQNISNSSAYSSGTFSNPICFTFNGIPGGEITKELLVRNDDSVNTVTNVVVNITSAYSFLTIQFKKEEADAWSNGPLNIGTVGQSADESFWVKMTCTQDAALQSIKDLAFQVAYDE